MEADFPNDLTDEMLVQLARAKNQEAFTLLFRRYYTLIYRFLVHLVKNEEDAQDLAQRTFEIAYRKLSMVKNGASFKSWLYQTAANGAKDHIRSKKRKISIFRWDQAEMENEEITGNFEERVIQAMLFEEAWERCQKTLTPMQTKCYLLHNRGMDTAAIAQQLNLSEGTVKTYISKVYRTLREEYQYLQSSHEDE